jgi:NADH-quinone oxidoreductase subunit L
VSTSLAHAAWLLPALPALAALALLLPGDWRERAAGPVAVLATAASLALAVALLVATSREPGRVVETAHPIAPLVSAGTRVDGLAALLALVVTLVATLVQVYSTAYLRGDTRLPTYAGLVCLFTAAMLVVVLAGDLLVLYVGWEVMGICSALLIAHDRTDRLAVRAGVQAFLTTRVGDLGLLLAVIVLGSSAGSFRISVVLGHLPASSHTALTAAGLLLVLGLAGKSAQVPLQTWLPDAMAGPTPVSALIHSATMVAAGVYVLARLYPVVTASTATLDTLVLVGVASILLGAVCACAADDLKRVLAWSTVSQLGYMTTALGVGGRDAAVFHLASHAAFKALLFLTAGVVVVAAGSTSMAAMGGLAGRMRLTAAAAAVGLTGLAGLPPASGFFSKDAVLAAARTAAYGDATVDVSRWAGVVALVGGLVGVAVTGAYATRVFCRVFLGPRRGAGGGEPGWVMGLPLAVLVVGTLAVGWTSLPGSGGFDRLVGAGGHPGLAPEVGTAVPSLLLALAGLLLVAGLHRADPSRDPAHLLGERLRSLLSAGFGVDALYRRVAAGGVLALGRGAAAFDRLVVDAAVERSGSGARAAGRRLRLLENGNAQAYVGAVLVGAVLLAVAGTVLR